MIDFNIYIENEYPDWDIVIEKLTRTIEEIFNFYMSCPEIKENCCLKDYDYETIAFDFLLCDGSKTHKINKEYREKDYPANIITFAVFADSPEEERFIIELEINLGEIIIALDKIIEEAEKKEISKESELVFMISHGILHLLGFDHQTMEDFEFVVNYQKKALESMGIRYDKI